MLGAKGDCVSPTMRSALGGAPARLLSAATGWAATTAPAGGAGGDSRWHALQEGGSNRLCMPGIPRASFFAARSALTLLEARPPGRLAADGGRACNGRHRRDVRGRGRLQAPCCGANDDGGHGCRNRALLVAAATRRRNRACDGEGPRQHTRCPRRAWEWGGRRAGVRRAREKNERLRFVCDPQTSLFFVLHRNQR
jgi:hypothetical protein